MIYREYNEGDWVRIVSCDDTMVDGYKVTEATSGVGVIGTVLDILGYDRHQNAYVIQEHGYPRQWGPLLSRDLEPAEEEGARLEEEWLSRSEAP